MRTKKLLMMIALLCTIVQGAWAESVTFRVRSWDESSKKVVTTETTKDATVLNSSDDWVPLGANDNQEDHYYVVKGNVSIKTLNCFGKVHLILCDNATLTCTGGILVQKSNNDTHLYIYSQSDGDSEGRLVVTNSYTGAAGIGCTQGENAGTIEIHGGNIDATGAKLGAGIGAGRNSDAENSSGTGGTVTIYGGTVKAQGGDSGAGIGGGASNRYGYSDLIQVSSGALFTLYGGTVTATGGDFAAGVGGGGGHAIVDSRSVAGGNGGQCYVYGGTLTAQGGHRSAGIGSGSKPLDGYYMTNNGTVHIGGGTVTATGGKYGAGIGGGCNCSGGTITIADGTVTATGGEDGAGIGGGEDGSGGTITISGGTVRAEGRGYGSGIGAGEFTGYFDDDLSATRGAGPTLTITGGTVIAIAGEDCKGREAEGGSAIGCGQSVQDKDASNKAGSLSLPDNYMVTGGDAENNVERVFTAGEREPACRWRNYVKIEVCSHTTPTVGSDHTAATSYTIDSDQHTMHCRYCAYSPKENHTFVANVCNACGKHDNTSDDMWSVTLHRASAAGSYSYADRVVMKVVKGQTFTIPAVSATEGLTLMGYTTSWTENMGIEMKDGETLTAVGAAVTPEADMDYYPRYRYRYVPTWTWDNSDATATLSIKCSALSSEAVNVSNITYSTSEDVKTATGTYNHNGATYTFTDTYLLPVGDLKLRETTSNEDALNNYNGRKVTSLTLLGRTLYADGSWNTLCLPFDLSQYEVQLQLNPSALKTLLSSAYDSQTSTLTLNFADATTIEAGKPYLIKWTSGGNRTNPSFSNVTIDNDYNAVTTDYVNFAGSFSPVSLEANDKTVLYLGADNTLYWPSADMTVNACRAVFVLNGLTADEKAKARAFVLNFGDESTGITTTNDTNDTNSDGAWFTLDGRKLSQKPSQHGIYIKNGKKVVIK